MAIKPVEIEIKANVKGQESVADLTNRLDNMAKVLDGDLKAQALAASAELRKLADQQAAIKAFAELSQETKDASTELKKAQAEAKAFGDQIGKAGPITLQEAQALSVMNARVNEASVKLRVHQELLSDGQAKLQSYGIAATQTAAAQKRLEAETNAVRQSVAGLVPAYQGASGAASTAGANMQRSHRAMADGMESISTQLQRVQSAYLALQGGGVLGGMIKDAAQTADEYNNLAARIKLATGEGEAFETAMAAVTDISLRTNSGLQATGDLFAKLTDAGKSAGMSSQDAAGQALALTESINQAVQLSGASAQASDAALTQLIQGLNGGALRGEEFNSVMEQSPRLAKALADGLGVTTGALRTMANEGRLTTDVVIGALQSQAATLKSEFETLPATVGRAVQNLSTAWTVYVGEADKATGASALAAQAINALASNLDTIAGYLLDAGQAAGAFAALKLAQTFLGIGAAATTSATAIAANTVAMNAAGVAGTTAAASVGRFATILAGLKTFSLLGIVTNFRDIGTWIGEGIAKLQGYKDKTDELAQADKARAQVAEENLRIAQAQTEANKAAMDAQFDLSAAAKSTLTVFDDLVTKGKTAAEAVAEIGKDFDLASLPGIANSAAVLDKLAADGKISADQFGAAWANALKGEDLQAFEVKARVALDGAARESEKLAAVMDGTLREAIRRSGADFDVLSGGMSKAARSAINDTDTIINGLDRLKAQGVDVGQALELSLNRAIKTADSQAAIDALRSRVEQLRNILGDKVADGLLSQIEEQAKRATGAISGLDGALKEMGITSDKELKKAAEESRNLYDQVKNAGGSTRELSEAFKKMAVDAIAANGGVATEALKTEAAMRGLEIVTDATGKTIVRAMGEGENATSSFTNGIKNAAGEVQGLMGWLDRLEKRNAEVKSVLITDKEGFAVDGDGKRIVQAVDNRASAASKLQSMGVDESKAQQMASTVYDERGNYTPKSSGYFRNPTDTLDAILQRMAAAEKAPAPAVGRNVSVTLNVAGKPETLNTDEQGAAALVRTLQNAGLAARG